MTQNRYIFCVLECEFTVSLRMSAEVVFPAILSVNLKTAYSKKLRSCFVNLFVMPERRNFAFSLSEDVLII